MIPADADLELFGDSVRHLCALAERLQLRGYGHFVVSVKTPDCPAPRKLKEVRMYNNQLTAETEVVLVTE